MQKKTASLLGCVVICGTMLSVGSISVNAAVQNGWEEADGKWYWYENGVLQGYDEKNPAYRGKEIYDPDSKAWYWLDNVQGGAKAVSKDVYQESRADDAGNMGKWVRYDAEGHMIKGWDTNEQGTYYFDLTYGTMLKGNHKIDGVDYYFNEDNGILESCSVGFDNHWVTIDGVEYWYENGIRQGYDPMDGSYRGKEIYDPGTDAWYWLDNVDKGKKATGKDVYQESFAGEYADREDGTGKWVRYDEKGHMIKGWNAQNGNTYYFDLTTGAMMKGNVTIDGVAYTFDKVSGILAGNKEEEYCEGICNLPKNDNFYKLEYAYKSQDTSDLSSDDMLIFTELKKCLDYAYQYTTPYEQEKAIHDYICMDWEYETGIHSLRDAIVSKKGQCSWYSSYFKLCMDILGFECGIVSSGQMNHAWNVVKLDNKWYMVDLTFDDSTMVVNGLQRDTVEYGYFNIPISERECSDATIIYAGDINEIFELAANHYYGNYVLEVKSDEDTAVMEAMLKEKYAVQNHDLTFFRASIQKEDKTVWTDEEARHYISKLQTSDYGGAYEFRYTIWNETTLCISVDGIKTGDIEYRISTDTPVREVEACLIQMFNNMEAGESINVYLENADGTEWSDISQAEKELFTRIGICEGNLFYVKKFYIDGTTAFFILCKYDVRMLEYSIEDIASAEDIDLSELEKECEKNLSTNNKLTVILRLKPNDKIIWTSSENALELYNVVQKIDSYENFSAPWCYEYYYEDGSVAQICFYDKVH